MQDSETKPIAEIEKNENNSESIPEEKKAPDDAKETQDQINWRLFREQREKERKEKLVLEQDAIRKSQEIEALKAAMEAIVNKPQATPSDDYEDDTDDQRIQKQINAAVEAAIKAKEAKEGQERAQREAREVPQRLEQSFPDFNRVCSTDNLDYLEFHYPEVAAAFKNQPETFDKWANVYKTVKRFIPNTQASKEVSRAEKNLSRPQSMSVPGMAATGDTAPRKLDDKARSDNWLRMQRIMKGV